MHIEKAVPAQAQMLSELAIRSKAHWGYSEEFMAACEKELTITSAQLQNESYHYGVAMDDKKLLGFYTVIQTTKEEFELDALFVEPDCIGEGVGSALLEHAKALALRLQGRRLIVQSDPNALDFYKAHGGKLIGYQASGSISGRQLPLLRIDLR